MKILTKTATGIVGKEISFSAAELTILKDTHIILSELNNEKVDVRIRSKKTITPEGQNAIFNAIKNAGKLLGKIAHDVEGLKEAEENLFGDVITEEELNESLNASTSSYHHDDDTLSDAERAERNLD